MLNKNLIIRFALEYVISFFYIPFIFALAIIARFKKSKLDKPRLVWGSTPIINNKYWSQSMKEVGYVSDTIVTDYYRNINKHQDWDVVLSDTYTFIPYFLRRYLVFALALFKYDVYFISFDGFFIGSGLIWKFQLYVLKIANKRIVVMPYGSDSYVYNRIRSTSLIHVLMMSYPVYSKRQKLIKEKVDFWCKWADLVIPAYMGPDGFGRWDVLIPSHLFIDLSLWNRASKPSRHNGVSGVVKIYHTPNHRGFKGTEFIVAAIEDLKSEGLLVELILLENIQNDLVRTLLHDDADILVEQIIATASAMSGLEGMATGIPVVANFEDDNYVLPMRRYTYFNECPIVSASPESIKDVLRKLITRPELRISLGVAGRLYVEKYHGLDSARYLFSNVLDFLYSKNSSLINLYHPILGDYPHRLPRVQHPLVNNRIVD